MDLRTLRYFVMVAEELHFGNAAKRLNIVQPALSVRIRSLESELGGSLLVRDKRHVELTAAGLLLKREAQRILKEIDFAVTAVREAMAGRTGFLDIGYADSLEAAVLARPVKLTRERYPDLQIRLWENDQSALLEAVSSGELHAAFARMVSFSEVPRTMEAIAVAKWPLRLALPVGHRLEKLSAVPVEAFRDEPFIAYAFSANGPVVHTLSQLLGREPNVVQKTNKTAVMFELVESGLGVALLPEIERFSSLNGNVVLKPVKGRTLMLTCYLLHRRGNINPVLKTFLACVRESFGLSGKDIF